MMQLNTIGDVNNLLDACESATVGNDDLVLKRSKFRLPGKYISLQTYSQRLATGRLNGINNNLWYALVTEVFQRDNYTCTYCGAIGGEIECDHIVPVSKGGKNEVSNLATACQTCNRKKGAKDASDFRLLIQNNPA